MWLKTLKKEGIITTILIIYVDCDWVSASAISMNQIFLQKEKKKQKSLVCLIVIGNLRVDVSSWCKVLNTPSWYIIHNVVWARVSCNGDSGVVSSCEIHVSPSSDVEVHRNYWKNGIFCMKPIFYVHSLLRVEISKWDILQQCLL